MFIRVILFVERTVSTQGSLQPTPEICDPCLLPFQARGNGHVPKQIRNDVTRADRKSASSIKKPPEKQGLHSGSPCCVHIETALAFKNKGICFTDVIFGYTSMKKSSATTEGRLTFKAISGVRNYTLSEQPSKQEERSAAVSQQSSLPYRRHVQDPSTTAETGPGNDDTSTKSLAAVPLQPVGQTQLSRQRGKDLLETRKVRPFLHFFFGSLSDIPNSYSCASIVIKKK